MTAPHARLLGRLAAVLALAAVAVATARLADPVGPPLRATSPEAAARLVSAARCGHGAIVLAGGEVRPLDARPSADGGALDQPLPGRSGLGPVRSSRIARGWPTPETRFCVVLDAPLATFAASGGRFVDDAGRGAQWHPWFARTDPVPTAARIAYHLADAWWIAGLAALLALAGALARRRSRAALAALGPTLGAALAVVFAAGL